MGGNTGNGGNNDKARKDLEVSAYEREIQKQKAKARAEANVELGLGFQPTEGTLSDPKEKDDTAAKKHLADFKKGNQVKRTGGDGGGQQQQEEVKAESAVDQQAAQEQADAAKKKRLTLVGSRSLFARRGGRGFFN